MCVPQGGDFATLPSDHHARWEELARYGLKHQHGQLCRLALMYALTLRRGAAAEAPEARYLRPHVWEAEGSRQHRSERVALFDDEMIRALLQAVEVTKDFPSPNFPRVACGSAAPEVWCHSLASRKPYRGKTNFEAVCEHFHLDVQPKLAPNTIHLAAAAVFRDRFACEPSEVMTVLAAQLGLKTWKAALYVAQRYSMGAKGQPIGRVASHDGGLVCILGDQESAEPLDARA